MNHSTALRDLLQKRRYSPRTIEAYVTWIDELRRYYPREELAALSIADIRQFFDHLRDTRRMSTSTLRQARCSIDFFYKNVVKTDLALRDLINALAPRPVPAIPTQAEIFRILDAVSNALYRTALTCIYGMGLTLGEAIALKARDVDAKSKLVRILGQGRRKERKVLLPDCLTDQVSTLINDKRADEYIFLSARGVRLDEKSLQRAVARAKKTAGVQGNITVRSLRHAYIKHLEFLGVPLVSVIENMGLSKAGTLEFYSSIGYPSIEVTFSPADRRIIESEENSVLSSESYVSEKRISELSAISSAAFDLSRLLALLRELNIAHRHGCFLSIAMLVRAVIDHIPPIFSSRDFAEVCNNYGGSASFKKSMTHLDKSLRNVADAYLHNQIRKRETAPTFIQVEFRTDIDVLLGEILRVLG